MSALPVSPLSVSQLVRRMKAALEFEVGEVWVEGEVSNLRRQASGHIYFSLKDEGAQLPCVLFKGRASRNGHLIEEGRKLKLFGELTVYEAQGRAQLLVSKVEAAGEGDLQARFAQLKRTLEAEGLFAQEHKKPLPPFPQKIALITSPTGAALQDMRTVFSRRAPWIELYLYPVTVQGKGAEHGLVRAIEALSSPEEHDLPRVDTIIIGRGGGSIEDLWNFNEEVVARALFACTLPVISAVGHETDFTIADFVSDQRAPTPSAAAELAVPDRTYLLTLLQGTQRQINRRVAVLVNLLEYELVALQRQLAASAPERLLAQREQFLDEYRERLPRLASRAAERSEEALTQLKARLSRVAPHQQISQLGAFLEHTSLQLTLRSEARTAQLAAELQRYQDILRTLGPDSTLARGYSITLRADGSALPSLQDLPRGERLRTILKDGQILSEVDVLEPKALCSDDT